MLQHSVRVAWKSTSRSDHLLVHMQQQIATQQHRIRIGTAMIIVVAHHVGKHTPKAAARHSSMYTSFFLDLSSISARDGCQHLNMGSNWHLHPSCFKPQPKRASFPKIGHQYPSALSLKSEMSFFSEGTPSPLDAVVCRLFVYAS